jgi:hypothetical protein
MQGAEEGGYCEVSLEDISSVQGTDHLDRPSEPPWNQNGLPRTSPSTFF